MADVATERGDVGSGAGQDFGPAALPERGGDEPGRAGESRAVAAETWGYVDMFTDGADTLEWHDDHDGAARLRAHAERLAGEAMAAEATDGR